MHMSRIRRFSAALAAAGVVGVAAPAAASAATLLTISGATASYPMVSLLAAKYSKTHKGKIKFKISQGGAQVGINDVASGRVSIADVSRDPEASDKGKGLVFYPVARYAICVITNRSNPLSNLTASQVTGIFTGKIKSWSAVPGASASGNIDVITRTSVAGVLSSFKTLLLEGKSIVGSATEEATEGLLKQQVENDPNSIGFVSNYQVELGGVNDVSYGGVACNKANAISGAYPGVAHFYEVTKGLATGAAAQFIGWIDKSPGAKKIINSQWISIG
jgi:phosphate transport system substrate-binding protein